MAFQPVIKSEGASLAGEDALCCFDILCDEDVPSECQEDLEVQEVNEPTEDWMLAPNGEALFEGAVVDPNTHEPVVTPPVVGCQSYVSSTELIESEPSTAMESVERYLCESRPESPADSVENEQELNQSQYNTVKRVILLNPGDDPERATAKAISDITDSLNQRAAERLAAGRTPEKETVIEITHIKAPTEAYFSQENVHKSQSEKLASSYIKAASQRAPASVSILQGRKGSSTPTTHSQPPQQHQHHRRKSPHLRKQMYTSTTPPCVPKQHQDLSDSCCFVTSAHIHPSSPSPASKLRTASSCEAKSSKARLAPGTAIYAAPSSSSCSKGPTILRSRSGLKNGLPRLKGNNKASCSSDNSTASPSLSNIDWVDNYNPQASKTADINPSKAPREHRRIITTEKQVDQVSRECGVKKRPPYSYMHLIEMAICSCDDKRMTLKEIYAWIENKFPFYKYSSNQGWKNSIRHNLSLYDIFIREKRNIPGKTGSSFWTLRSDLPSKTTRSIRSMIAEVEASSDQKSSSDDSESSKQKRGQVRLLPKPPPTADNQAYALIPIQNGVPVIPQQPLMVSSWQLGSSSQLAMQEGQLPQPQGLTTPTKAGFRGHAPSKASLKRNRSPHEIVEGSSRKQAKRVFRLNAFGEWQCSSAASSSVTSSSDLGRSWDTSDLQQQFSQIKFDSGIDLQSGTDVSSSSFSEETGSLPKPTMYPKPTEQILLNQEDEEDDSGLQDILDDIEKDLSTPMRRLLQTPPRSADKHLFSSTPFKSVFGSPCFSPIEGLAPIKLEEADLDIEQQQQQDACNRTSTPFSPSTDNAASQGSLSPVSCVFPKSHFDRFLSDIQLDEMIEEGISEEVELNLAAFQ